MTNLTIDFYGTSLDISGWQDPDDLKYFEIETIEHNGNDITDLIESISTAFLNCPENKGKFDIYQKIEEAVYAVL